VVNLFRETETDRLKKDADDMEARLLQLQDKMRTQMGEGGAQAEVASGAALVPTKVVFVLMAKR